MFMEVREVRKDATNNDTAANAVVDATANPAPDTAANPAPDTAGTAAITYASSDIRGLCAKS